MRRNVFGTMSVVAWLAIVGSAQAAAPHCLDGTAAATAKNTTLVLPPPPCSDADGDGLIISVVSGPSHGRLSAPDPANRRSYTPASGYAGGDSIQFKANDGTSDSNIATLTIDVVGSPDPVQGKSVNVRVVSGKVRIKRRGSTRFQELDGLEQIPVGSTIDTTDGRVRLTAASDKAGATQVAEFYEGAFVVKQSKGNPLTELALTGASLSGCKRAGKAGASAAKPVRRLWASGKGSFRTRGRYAAAAVRGTQWLTQDTCAGTLVRVKKGTVRVRDFTKKKNVTVKADRSYLAKA